MASTDNCYLISLPLCRVCTPPNYSCGLQNPPHPACLGEYFEYSWRLPHTTNVVPHLEGLRLRNLQAQIYCFPRSLLWKWVPSQSNVCITWVSILKWNAFNINNKKCKSGAACMHTVWFDSTLVSAPSWEFQRVLLLHSELLFCKQRRDRSKMCTFYVV